MSSFSGKVVWITGASSGIGKELAYQLSAKGAKLVLSARNEEQLKKVAANCSEAIILPLDLSDSTHFTDRAKQVVEQFGSIDFLVNNGGVSQRANAADTPLEIDRKIMEVNYFGAVALTKAVLPQMKKQGSGHILVISSIAGKFGFYLRSAYSAAKHALHGFYESLRLEEETNGIKVTIACPGKIQTDISVNAVKADGSLHGEMDKSQAEGMPVSECVRQLIAAVENDVEEVLIGGREIKAVKLKRLFPKLFRKVIRKQSPT